LYGLNKKSFGFLDKKGLGFRKTMKLIKIDPATGQPETIGDTQFDVVGLAYNPVTKKLYATAHRDYQIVEINPSNGKGTPVVTLSDRNHLCGEIAFDSEGKAYITLTTSDLKKHLATCDLTTGKVSMIGDIGFPGLASMKFIGNTLYGIAGEYAGLGGSNGQVISIDIATGQGSLVITTDPPMCWAGMAVYGNTVTVTQPQTFEPIEKTTPSSEVIPPQSVPALQSTIVQSDTTTKEEEMTILTIDTKDNCYLINTEEMNHLQENVARSFSLESGTFDIQITSGHYNHSQSQTEGEPFVLLWIYGVDGNTFINKNTGIEVGTTWTTLNGYGDRLQLEVTGQAVLCALFLDVNNEDNSGSVELSISSNKKYFNPQTVTVDSKENCYVLNADNLKTLQQKDANLIELTPGNYRFKIRESNASYWSSEKKFQLEPWALLWIKEGKFIPKLTGNEVEETWCSLNGLKDEVILEVKEKTIVSGFFFDTYKEDNEGQIILAIETVSATELTEIYEEHETTITSSSSSSQQSYEEHETTTTSSSSSSSSQQNVDVSTSGDTSSQEETVGVGISGSGMNFSSSSGSSSSSSGSSSFSFQFDQSQMEDMWEQISSKIETSVAVNNTGEENKQAYWDNLEKWILQGYQQQVKDLTTQVARVEFMMKAFSQQMEGNFNQIFQAWSSHFDSRLNELINTRIVATIEEQVRLKTSQQTQDIKKLVVDQMQSDIDKRLETALNLKLSQQTQDIKKLVVEQMQGDIDKRIETVVNVKFSDQTPNINSSIINNIQEQMDQRINTVVTMKIDDQTENLKNLVIQQLQTNMDNRIDNAVELKITDQTENLKNLVIQQLQTNMDNRIDNAVELKITDKTEALKNLVIQQLEANIDKRIQMFVEQSTNNNLQLVANNVMGNIDNRITANFENQILNLREDLTSLVRSELNNNYTDSLKSLLFADIKNQQFYLDTQSIKAEVENFYSRLGQFETQLNLRIAQGDTRLYNWTLEQLSALQGCISDRQALVNMFESFSAKLKTALDGAPCVQPTRFSAWVTTENNPQIEPIQPNQLPEG
ncbi:MAG: hypothetical protein WA865_20635, partial [Spirulinaceae cyanobacterium]